MEILDEMILRINWLQYLEHLETQYVFPQNGLNTQDEIEACEENEKERYAINSALSKTELDKVISLKTYYEVWEKLEDIYEENDRVKLSKNMTTKRHYENLRMKYGEDIKIYFQRVENVINEVKHQGGTITGEDFMEKILMK